MTVPPKNLISRCLYTNNNLFRNFFFTLFVILVLTILTIFISVQFFNSSSDVGLKFEKVNLHDVHKLPEVKLLSSSAVSRPTNPNCTHWDCFNIYKCGHTGHDRIAVYVYPLRRYVDERGVSVMGTISKEYFSLLKAVVKSKYYTTNPHEACIFIPSIDTLNQDQLHLNFTSKALHSLPFWGDNGENHLIFNMLAGGPPNFSSVVELNLADALIAGAGFDTYSFRQHFDISIPVYSPVSKLAEVRNLNHQRTWLVISSQLNIDPIYVEELQKISHRFPDTLVLLDACQPHRYLSRCELATGRHHDYPAVLRDSTFCLIFRGERSGQFTLHEALAAGCVPVVVISGVVMPFSEVIDWHRVALFVVEEDLGGLMGVVSRVSPRRLLEMQRAGRYVYERYFASVERVVMTVLDVIQDRVYPHLGKVYDEWNLRPEERNTNPLFLPLTAPKSHGFTAVILTYDRVESLYTLIERLSKVPSLMKVIVVWNNQMKSPPPMANFPKIFKPIKVIRTKANKLSNRFYPYSDIETEAILHIDDDIVMLTADEVEFGYEVWREFPDRLVGFPSRTHVWDNVTNSWKYESEWTNEISMVLTGAAFLHKYWNYLYTTGMPAEVKDWADEHMNCEDIAMNFLVANVTKKPPIKVTPRKKFKCPECASNEMLSADLGHMVERSQCVDRFARVFGQMPLRSVEFRADPVLFKDSFPEKLKRFNDIGSL